MMTSLITIFRSSIQIQIWPKNLTWILLGNTCQMPLPTTTCSYLGFVAPSLLAMQQWIQLPIRLWIAILVDLEKEDSTKGKKWNSWVQVPPQDGFRQGCRIHSLAAFHRLAHSNGSHPPNGKPHLYDLHALPSLQVLLPLLEWPLSSQHAERDLQGMGVSGTNCQNTLHKVRISDIYRYSDICGWDRWDTQNSPYMSTTYTCVGFLMLQICSQVKEERQSLPLLLQA